MSGPTKKRGEEFDVELMINPAFWGRVVNQSADILGSNDVFQVVFGAKPANRRLLDVLKEVLDLDDNPRDMNNQLFRQYKTVIELACTKLAEMHFRLVDNGLAGAKLFEPQEAADFLKTFEPSFWDLDFRQSVVLPYLRMDKDGLYLAADLQVGSDLLRTKTPKGQFKHVTLLIGFKFFPTPQEIVFQGMFPRGEQTLLVQLSEAHERLNVFGLVQSSAYQLCELLRQVHEPVQQLTTLLSPAGALIFGGTSAQHCFPIPSGTVVLNPRVRLESVPHDWVTEAQVSSRLDVAKEHVAAIVLSVLGEGGSARRPLWTTMSGLLEHPDQRFEKISRILCEYAPELCELKPNATQVYRAFCTLQRWFRYAFKEQIGTWIPGLPASLLTAVLDMWEQECADLKKVLQEKHIESIWVLSQRPIDTMDALDAIRVKFDRFDDVLANVESNGQRHTTVKLTLTIRKGHGFDKDHVQDLVTKFSRKSTRFDRGDMQYVLAKLGGGVLPDLAADPTPELSLKGLGGTLTVAFPEKKIVLTWDGKTREP